MTHEEAVRKALGCLRLSKSPNQHEAALAAAKAQEIMDRYQLSAGALENGNQQQVPDEPIKSFDSDPLADVGYYDRNWVLRLAILVARNNQCRVYYTSKYSGGGRKVHIVGRPSDVQTARYIFGWLDKEVRRISKEETSGNSAGYKRDFRIGVVDTISRKLNEQREQTFESVQAEAQNSMALVLVKQSIAKLEEKGEQVDEWMKNHMDLGKGRASSAGNSNWSARQHGQKSGHNVRFTHAKAGIAGGGKAISSGC